MSEKASMSERANESSLLRGKIEERIEELKEANKTISFLKSQLDKLSEELKTKSTLLTKCMDVAHEQSLQFSLVYFIDTILKTLGPNNNQKPINKKHILKYTKYNTLK